MAEGRKLVGKPQSVRQIFERARGIASRAFSNSRREQVMDIADRYAANIRAYLGSNYDIDKEVPRSVYTGGKRR